MGRMVVPDTQSQNHTSLESLAHLPESTLGLEVVGIAKHALSNSTEVLVDGVTDGNTGDVDVGVLDHTASLHVKAADLDEVTRSSVSLGDELSNDSHLAVSVDGLAGAVERSVAQAVGVEVAPVLVANASVPVGAITALGARAARWSRGSTWVRGVGS